MPASRVAGLRPLAEAWLPVVVWAGVIFVLSSIPNLSSGLGTWDLVLRKAAHSTEYAILGLLLLRALGREVPAFLLAVAYAVSDEVHQHFVSGRNASPADVAVDAAGVALGLVLYRTLRVPARRAWAAAASVRPGSTLPSAAPASLEPGSGARARRRAPR
ncbi:MAG: VanZ family protein [Actinomycetota bacterium]|nr:VanZ family protein [Actinomycetota bacterium]